MGRRWMLGVLALALACGDDDASEPPPEPETPAPEAPAPEAPAPEPPAPPARMVVLIGEKALELRTMANPSEGEPWAAEREPVDGSFVLLGATADHVLLQEPVVDRLGLASRFHVVVRGGAAAEPVQAGRALVAPDGEHWLVERSYQRFRCGGMGRGRNLFVRTFGSDEERAIGEGFVGFGPEQTLVLSITTSDCGPAGGLRNHQSFVRMGATVRRRLPPASQAGSALAQRMTRTRASRFTRRPGSRRRRFRWRWRARSSGRSAS